MKGADMNKQQFNKTIETVINSPRSDLQKIGMLQNAFALYVKEETDRIVAELEEQKVRYKNIRNNTHCIITETSECDSCRADHYLDARLNCVDRAISIVRKGGVK